MGSQHKDCDILQELISGTPSDTESIPAVRELTQLIERYSEISGGRNPAARSQPASKNKRQNRARLKKKTTYYLTVHTSEALEQAKEEMRSLVSPRLRRLVSKSRIVEMALRHLLQELDRNRSDNELVQRLLCEKQGI